MSRYDCHILKSRFVSKTGIFALDSQSCTDEAISLILATHMLRCLSHHLDAPLHSLCVAWVECDDGRSWFPYKLSEVIVADTPCDGWLVVQSIIAVYILNFDCTV